MRRLGSRAEVAHLVAWLLLRREPLQRGRGIRHVGGTCPLLKRIGAHARGPALRSTGRVASSLQLASVSPARPLPPTPALFADRPRILSSTRPTIRSHGIAEIIDVKKEKNFFETRVIEYQTGGALSWG